MSMLRDVIDIIRDNWLLLLIGQYPNGPLGGFSATILLSVLSIVLAFPVGVVIALGRLSKNPLLFWPATALVFFARGVPLLMLILWVYFMVPVITGINVPGFVTMLVTLVIYEATFLGEVVRGGILALGKGQMEAATALGHSKTSAMIHIILPQALFNTIPSLLSQFVSTIKETTLGYVINVPELTFAANQINNQLLTKPFQIFFILAIIYYVVCWSLTFAATLLERRISARRAGVQPAAQDRRVQAALVEP